MVELEDLTQQDRETLQKLLENHVDYTGSAKAKTILDAWPDSSNCFIKVMPTDYKRALELLAQQDEQEKIS